MKCQLCEAEGKESCILTGRTDTTLTHHEPFYDEKGQFHNHNTNDTKTSYRCSNGHTWYAYSKSKCWYGWPDDPNWRAAVEPDFRLHMDPSVLPGARPGEVRCTGTWCPQCGPDAATDKEGCCALCGSDAIGLGAERALLSRRLAKESLPYLRGLHSECPAHRGHASCEVCPEYGVCKLVLLVVATEAL